MIDVACDYRNVSKPSKNTKAWRKILSLRRIGDPMKMVVEYLEQGFALVPIPLGRKAVTRIKGAKGIAGNAVKPAIKTLIKLGRKHMALIRQAVREMAEERGREG